MNKNWKKLLEKMIQNTNLGKKKHFSVTTKLKEGVEDQLLTRVAERRKEGIIQQTSKFSSLRQKIEAGKMTPLCLRSHS